MSTKKQLKRIYKKILKLVNKYKKNVYLSFGENCLTDRILERHHIKSFSSPYSSGRSNVEYILQIEKEAFRDLLEKQYLYRDVVGDHNVVRNKKYTCTNIYDESCMRDFEFTHHDVLSDDIIRNTISRRCQALLEIQKKNLHIFYHHRICDSTNEGKLIEDLAELKRLYEQRAKSVSVTMFTQKKVEEEEERRVDHKRVNDIDIYTFYTLNIWEGSDDNIFWAKCDDDLIKTMINDVKKRK